VYREPVDSDALRSVGYDIDSRILEIEFTNDSIYRYFDVPPVLHFDLMRATSHGAFFADRIRDAGFDYERIA
jgi:hypothetical protein